MRCTSNEIDPKQRQSRVADGRKAPGAIAAYILPATVAAWEVHGWPNLDPVS